MNEAAFPVASDLAEGRSRPAAGSASSGTSDGMSSQANVELLELKLARQEALIANLRFEAENVPILKTRLRNLESSSTLARKLKERSEAELADRYAELALITSSLLKEERRSSRLQELSGNMLQIIQVMTQGEPWWASLAPRSWRQARLRRRLEKRGLFDAQAYAVRFPDVVAAGHDPFRHFLMHGMGEMLEGKR